MPRAVNVLAGVYDNFSSAVRLQTTAGEPLAMPHRTRFLLAVLIGLLLAQRLSCGDETTIPERVDVFVSGTEGYHTYRIPAAIVTRAGTLLAFCEGRKANRNDHGDIDLLLKRSADGGKRWSPPQ